MKLNDGINGLQHKLAEAALPLTFAVSADPHAPPNFKRLYGAIADSGAAFHLVCGDLSMHSMPQQFQGWLGTLERWLPEVPTFATPGDHDIYNGGGVFNQIIGQRTFGINLPALSTFVYSLDTTAHTMTIPQRKAMRQAFATSGAKHRILFTHIPPATLFNPPLPLADGAYTDHPELLVTAIQNLELQAAFFGHVHRNERGKCGQCKFWCTDPDTFILVTVTDDGVEMQAHTP